MASKSKVTQKIPASPWGALLPPPDEESSEKSLLLDRQRILYRYGDLLERDQLKLEFKVALGKALKAIALGANAEEVLLGERAKHGVNLLADKMRRDLALAWIAAAMDTHLGLGLSKKEAIREASKEFHFTEKTLTKYWNSSGANRSPWFNYP